MQIKSIANILWKAFIKPFYKENAALFIFIFTMMFFIVNKVDGAELLKYHYSLILATLKSPVILLIIFGFWLIYVRKYFVFIESRLQRAEFSFLNMFNSFSTVNRFWIFGIMSIILSLPVLLYVLIIIIIGVKLKIFLPVFFVVLFFAIAFFTSSVFLTRKLGKPLVIKNGSTKKSMFGNYGTNYPVLLIRYIFQKQKLLWIGLIVFTCGVLFLIEQNNSINYYDVKPGYLFYSFGILAHSILIYRIREFEDQKLAFYRGLPYQIWIRFFHYNIIASFLFFPEFLTIGFLFPAHLHYSDAIGFCLSGYFLLLLIAALTFADHFTMIDFLKVLLFVFFVQYFLMMALGFFAISLLFAAMSVIIFYSRYSRFERIY